MYGRFFPVRSGVGRRYSLPSGPHPYMDTEVRSIHWPADSLITSDAYTHPASSYDSTHARITFFSLITLSDAFEGSRRESAKIARRPSGSGDSDNSLVPASPDSAGHLVTSTQDEFCGPGLPRHFGEQLSDLRRFDSRRPILRVSNFQDLVPLMNVTVCPVFNVDHFLNVIDEQPLISAMKLSEFADSIGIGAVRIAAIEESSDRGQLKLTSDVLEFQGRRQLCHRSPDAAGRRRLGRPAQFAAAPSRTVRSPQTRQSRCFLSNPAQGQPLTALGACPRSSGWLTP